MSRIFEREDGPVAMWLSPPQTDPAAATVQSHAIGIDAMQAMLLAIASAAHRLHYVGDGTPDRRSPVRWLGSDDLGLTIKHFERR